MLSRKYYNQFAAMFKELRTLSRTHKHIDLETLDIALVEVSRIFEDDNPRFDADRFIRASMPDPIS